jgi:hypothetical protein
VLDRADDPSASREPSPPPDSGAANGRTPAPFIVRAAAFVILAVPAMLVVAFAIAMATR